MKKIALTGGGTAGHVMPNLALLPELKKSGYEVVYIGSKDGIEKTLCQDEGIVYYVISTGKLRRYFSLRNFTDPFRVIAGFFNSLGHIRKIKPNVIFSKGGFVAVPVVIAGWFSKIPVVVHESDITPGFANKLSAPFASAICATFPETMSHIKPKKAHLTGLPIRKELLSGDSEQGRRLCGFQDDKPVLMIIGGSLGAVAINNAVRELLDKLTPTFNIIHICGKGNKNSSLDSPSYIQFEFVSNELSHLYALSDLVLSRAGANVICELLALKKPALLIPLTRKSSRGDQILNAESFKSKGYSMVLYQEDMTPEALYNGIMQLNAEKDNLIRSMEDAMPNGTANVLSIVFSCTKEK